MGANQEGLAEAKMIFYGLHKRQIKLTWARYEKALIGDVDMTCMVALQGKKKGTANLDAFEFSVEIKSTWVFSLNEKSAIMLQT